MELNGIDPLEQPKTHPLMTDEEAGSVEEVATANKTWAITSAEAAAFTAHDLATALFSNDLIIGSDPVVVKANFFPAVAILLYFAAHSSALARTDSARARVDRRRRAAVEVASEKRKADEKAARKQSPRNYEIKVYIRFVTDPSVGHREIHARA